MPNQQVFAYLQQGGRELGPFLTHCIVLLSGPRPPFLRLYLLIIFQRNLELCTPPLPLLYTSNPRRLPHYSATNRMKVKIPPSTVCGRSWWWRTSSPPSCSSSPASDSPRWRSPSRCSSPGTRRGRGGAAPPAGEERRPRKRKTRSGKSKETVFDFLENSTFPPFLLPCSMTKQ